MLDCDKCPALKVMNNENGYEEECGLGLWNSGKRCNYRSYKNIKKQYEKNLDEEAEFWARMAESYIKENNL